MAEEESAGGRRWVAVAIVIVVVGSLGVWLKRAAVEVGGGRPSPISVVSVAPEPGKKAADVPLIQLGDFYEHNVEHAPPRDPSGAMQRREKYYTAPAEPMALLKSKFTASEGDGKLLAWMEQWQQIVSTGARRPWGADWSGLDGLLAGCSLSAEWLLEVGRGVEFLDSSEHAARWYRAGIAKAEVQFAGLTSMTPEAERVVHLMEQTKGLWRTNGISVLERRYALVIRLSPRLSVEGRRAGYMRAQMLWRMGRRDEAADAIVATQKLHDEAGDLGKLEASDIYEMRWILGLFQQQAGRLEASVPHLEFVAKAGGEHSYNAWMLWGDALYRLGRKEEAEAVRKEAAAKGVQFGYSDNVMTPDQAERMRAQQELAMARLAAARAGALNVTTRPTTRPAKAE